MVATALEAAGLLEQEGIGVRVINMHTIKPLDEETVIAAARETGVIVTAEEHSIVGGLGGAVAETVCTHHPVPVYRLGIPDVFGESGRPEELLEKYGLTAAHLAARVREAVKRKGR
jgi:transketolase